MSDEERPSALAVAAARLTLLWFLMMSAGAYGAAFGWRPGAYLAITAVFGYNASHLVMGITEYRRVMRRPWPHVPNLDADDDEW